MTDEIDLLRRFRDEMPGPSTDAWARARSAVALASSEEEAARAGEELTGVRPSRPLRAPWAGGGARDGGGTRRGRARWSPGRRRLLSAAVMAGLAAAVAAAVLVPEALAPQRVTDAADLVSRVEQALGQPGTENLIGYARTTYPPGSILEPTASGLHSHVGPARSPWRVGFSVRWTYRSTMRTTAFAPTGQPVFSEWITAAHGAPRIVGVIYGDRTWWRATPQPQLQPAGSASSSCGPDVTLGPGGWPDFIRHELSCGEYQTAGRQQVDGIDAIKITGNQGLDVLWVDPATYLPVRAILTFGRQQIQTDFRWLAPTAANLDRLSLPVPAGFRQVAPPSS
jgi:hypothetical protein